MPNLLAHPFRITGTGAAASVQQDSDEQYDQQLRIIIGTKQGEREMATGYGLTDPVWRGLYIEDVQAAADLYGPPVTITDLDTTIVDETSQVRFISWTRADTTGDLA